MLRAADPDEYLRRVGESVLAHVAAIRDAAAARARRRSTTATRCAGSPQEHGDEDAFAYPGFVPAYIRPLFCEGKGPFRWVALSGDPADIDRDRRGDPRALRRPGAHRALDRAGARARRASRGCPRASAGSATASATSPGCASTRWSPRASCKAPIVIGRDHLDAGSVASPAARDRGDARRLGRGRRLAAAQRAREHRLRRDAGCRSTMAAASAWASRSTPVRSCVADGTELAAERLERVLTRRSADGRRPSRRRRLPRGDRRRRARLRSACPMRAMSSLSVHSAAQVLRLPERRSALSAPRPRGRG